MPADHSHKTAQPSAARARRIAIIPMFDVMFFMPASCPMRNLPSPASRSGEHSTISAMLTAGFEPQRKDHGGSVTAAAGESNDRRRDQTVPASCPPEADRRPLTVEQR